MSRPFVMKSREFGYNIFVADKLKSKGSPITDTIKEAEIWSAPYDLTKVEYWIAVTGYELEVEYLN